MVPEHRILLGVIGRPHGVQGLVHVTSHTADPAALAGYGPLSDEAGRRFTLAWKGEGVAELREDRGGVWVPITDRDAAARLANMPLYVQRDALPEPAQDEFYLADLIGLQATDADGTALGAVVSVHDYGAGASLEITRDGASLLVPFTRAAVPEVDVAGGRIAIVLPAEVDAEPPTEPISPPPRLREESDGHGGPGSAFSSPTSTASGSSQ
jgi:16S rRNA processing protein RimM